ncbi:MAG: hypothetical protein FJ087_11175 [Deltaproteobacteria bacterium]|nr:hypothetical protein [Deltaproteobacteria bacterium]
MMRVGKDVRRLLDDLGLHGFPYREYHKEAEAVRASARWHVIVETNRALREGAPEPALQKPVQKATGELVVRGGTRDPVRLRQWFKPETTR